MTEILGVQSIIDLGLPTGHNAAYIRQWQLHEGRSYPEFVNLLAISLADMNQRLVSKWGWLFGTTQENNVEYANGGSVTAVKEATDLDDFDILGGDTIGHMLPLKLYGNGVGGSWKYFQRTREAKIAAHLTAIRQQHEKRFEQMLLTRAFHDTENAVGASGAGGWDVPWVDTGGNVTFTPPELGGQNFANHTHFVGYNLSTPLTFADVLDGLALHLAEHGHEAPFDALVSRSNLPTIRALTNFVELVSPVIQMTDRGGATSGSQYFAQGSPQLMTGIYGYYQSPYGQVNIRETPRLATGHVGMFKSDGVNVPTNPMMVRVAEEGFGAYVVTETADNTQWPVKSVKIAFEFGVGVNSDRTKGAHGFLVAGGNYANGTIG